MATSHAALTVELEPNQHVTAKSLGNSQALTRLGLADRCFDRATRGGGKNLINQ